MPVDDLPCANCVEAPAKIRWEKYRLCPECHDTVVKTGDLPEVFNRGGGWGKSSKKPSMDEQLPRILIPVKGTDFKMWDDDKG